MRISEKRTCHGCKALFMSDIIDTKCRLGYPIEKVKIDSTGAFWCRPTHQCHKPKTYSEFFEAQKEIETSGLNLEALKIEDGL